MDQEYQHNPVKNLWSKLQPWLYMVESGEAYTDMEHIGAEYVRRIKYLYENRNNDAGKVIGLANITRQELGKMSQKMPSSQVAQLKTCIVEGALEERIPMSYLPRFVDLLKTPPKKVSFSQSDPHAKTETFVEAVEQNQH